MPRLPSPWTELSNMSMKTNSSVHQPVLLQEVLEYLELKPGLKVFDGTLGGGGYAEEICRAIGEEGILLGTDLDAHALGRVEERLKNCSCQKKFYLKNYSEIKKILAEDKEVSEIDRMVLDLGISSDQLDLENRGISFQNPDAPLDMNLSLDEKKLTAEEILNRWSEESLADIFFYYGGERASRKIAKAAVERRKEKAFKRVGDLVELIEKEIGHFYKNKKIHPATKIFQALRITVNDEIGHLEKALKEGFEVLGSGGIVVVVTFHSLEDRKVKKIFREFEGGGLGRRVNKKVITPGEEELAQNRRARSAKLRAFKKN